MDGTPTLRMNEFMVASLANNIIDLGPPRDSQTGASLSLPVELKFEVNSDIEGLVTGSATRFDELVGKHDLHVSSFLHDRSILTLCQVLHYEGYGKNYIKKFKASPDAWAQLVKQLAFHKMFSRPGVTYESAQTRKFQLGRTEVIRSASTETKQWAEAMLDPRKTVCIYHNSLIVSVISVGHRTGRTVPCCHYPAFAICFLGCRWAGSRPASIWPKKAVERRRTFARIIQG